MAEVIFSRIAKRFGKNEVVHDFTLTVHNGEFLTLVGPSGCGKTTTLRMLAGLEEITDGDIFIDGIRANHIPPQKRDIAMVFQSYALFPHMTVAENIAFGLKLKGTPHGAVVEKIAWALKLLTLQGLDGRLPRDLSGGQRQRVALARALVLTPKVLLLDEPLSNLDAKLRLRMRAELKRIHRDLHSTILYVTHDQIEAMSLSDRVAVMHEGSLVQVGTPMDVYSAPENIFVAGFIGSPAINLLPARLTTRGTEIFIALESCRLGIPARFHRACRPYLEHDIIFGIRPEHIYDMRFSQQVTHEATAEITVDVVEPLGDRDILEVTMAGIPLTMVSDVTGSAYSTMKLTVSFDMEKAHIFDKKSEKNILI